MDNSPALLRQASPFPAPASQSSGQWSALEYIVSFLALIAIPSLIYLFFFALKCPPNPFMRRRRRSEGVAGELSTGGGGNDADNVEVASDVKYRKEAHVIEIGSECPVCLSVFNDGEEVRQLTACKHSFHPLCIDLWLQSHSNCPICRASVHLSKIPVPSAELPESGGLP